MESNLYDSIILPDAKTQLKKRIAFIVISGALFLSLLGVRTLPTHTVTHTLTIQTPAS